MPPAVRMPTHWGKSAAFDMAKTGAYKATPMYKELKTTKRNTPITRTALDSYLLSKY
jgi:hypothetical protein